MLDLARSAEDPANPISHLGNTVAELHVETFADSYGDPQKVQVVAKNRSATSSCATASTTAPSRPPLQFMGGERFGQEPGLYYHRLRGTVTGTNPGDEVEVWFEGGRRLHALHLHRSLGDGQEGADHERRELQRGRPDLPGHHGPSYLTYYTDALDANGVAYDIYDVDKRGNVSPDHLGVLSHYDAVLWYTGDDDLTRRTGQPAATGTARLAVEEMIDVRHFLNEGGKLFFTGNRAGQQWAQGNVFRNFGFPEPPEGGIWCDNAKPEFDGDNPANADGCIAHNDASSSTTWAPTSTRRPATRSTTRTTPRTRCGARSVRRPVVACSTRPAPTTRTTRRRS